MRIEAFEERHNEQVMRSSLDRLEERRETAGLRVTKHQSRADRYYNSRVRQHRFTVGSLVLRKVMLNTKNLVNRALRFNWEGPYGVIGIIRSRTYTLEDMHGKTLQHLWNSKHLQVYYP